MKKKKLLLTVGVLGLTTGALVVADDQGWIGAPSPVEITAATARPTTIVAQVEAEGKLMPEKEVPITSDVSGELVDLLVQEGDMVRKGQLLLRIRPDTYRAAVSQRQAGVATQAAGVEQLQARLRQQALTVEQENKTFSRQANLFAEKVISRADYEAAQATCETARGQLKVLQAQLAAARGEVQQAQASLALASATLEKTAVYAPIAGVVSHLAVKVGERVVGTAQMAGTQLLRVADPAALEVRANVGESDIERVKPGDSARVVPPSAGRQESAVWGVVTQVAAQAQESPSRPNLVEYEVHVRVLADSYRQLLARRADGRTTTPFRPGMKASLSILSSRRTGVLSVPLDAVTTRPEKRAGVVRIISPEDLEEGHLVQQSANEPRPKKEIVVFVIKGSQVVRTRVKVGLSDLHNIEITQGLAAGDRVASGPYRAVSKGLRNLCPVVVRDPADIDRNATYETQINL